MVPFAGLAATVAVSGDPAIRIYAYVALVSYGACILSFLGAVHAGFALRQTPVATWQLLAAAAAPVLAWLSLALGERTGLLLMTASHLGVLACDIVAARRGLAPVWYPRLRWPLTGVVLICLLAALQFGSG
ncbi:MAG: DUF3429 domain-containing protein [Alphaproteobacteria bacterium]|nr:DUF3429 domain-containing protein [Alphaproteobacteria bacterium]